MPLLHIHPMNPQERLLRQAAQIIENGGVIAYPSDTSYALAADIFNKKAADKLQTLKRGDKTQLFSCICYDYAKISELAFVSTQAYRIMNSHLPGPFTFILKGKSTLPKVTLTKRKTIGIRMPDAPIVKALYAACSNPFLSCSISAPSGEPLNDADEIHRILGHTLDLVIHGGPVLYAPSSIISLEEDIPQIIREGSGSLDAFES